MLYLQRLKSAGVLSLGESAPVESEHLSADGTRNRMLKLTFGHISIQLCGKKTWTAWTKQIYTNFPSTTCPPKNKISTMCSLFIPWGGWLGKWFMAATSQHTFGGLQKGYRMVKKWQPTHLGKTNMETQNENVENILPLFSNRWFSGSKQYGIWYCFALESMYTYYTSIYMSIQIRYSKIRCPQYKNMYCLSSTCLGPFFPDFCIFDHICL